MSSSCSAAISHASRDRFTWREGRAIRRLDKLADWAEHFHHQVESYRHDPAHTEGDFQDLVRAYMRARDAVHRDLHATTRVRDDFRRVETIMEHLTGFYGGTGYYGRIYPGYFRVDTY